MLNPSDWFIQTGEMSGCLGWTSMIPTGNHRNSVIFHRLLIATVYWLHINLPIQWLKHRLLYYFRKAIDPWHQSVDADFFFTSPQFPLHLRHMNWWNWWQTLETPILMVISHHFPSVFLHPESQLSPITWWAAPEENSKPCWCCSHGAAPKLLAHCFFRFSVLIPVQW